MKSKEFHSQHAVGNAMLVLVLVVAIVGLYYMYRVSTGRAFFEGPHVEAVIQNLPESCCCATEAGKLFEVTAQILKGADQLTRVASCSAECKGPSHSTVSHSSLLVKPGKCDTPQ